MVYEKKLNFFVDEDLPEEDKETEEAGGGEEPAEEKAGNADAEGDDTGEEI